MDRWIVPAGVATAQLLALALIWLLSGWRGAADRSTNTALLRYNPLMRGAGLLLLFLGTCFPAFVAVLVVVVPPPESWHYVAVTAVAAAVALGGCYVWRETRGAYALISGDGVERFSPWCGTTFLYWQDVTRAEIGPSGVVTLWTRSRGKVFFPVYWAGLDLLAEAAERHLADGKVVYVQRC
jgi:hypothetical protein